MIEIAFDVPRMSQSWHQRARAGTLPILVVGGVPAKKLVLLEGGRSEPKKAA